MGEELGHFLGDLKLGHRRTEAAYLEDAFDRRGYTLVSEKGEYGFDWGRELSQIGQKVDLRTLTKFRNGADTQYGSVYIEMPEGIIYHLRLSDSSKKLWTLTTTPEQEMAETDASNLQLQVHNLEIGKPFIAKPSNGGLWERKRISSQPIERITFFNTMQPGTGPLREENQRTVQMRFRTPSLSKVISTQNYAK